MDPSYIIDEFYESISAPQFYDFLKADGEDNRDSWFATHQENSSDLQFNGKLLSEETFDKMTPPKLRSPTVLCQDAKYKKPSPATVLIPIPKFLNDEPEIDCSEDIVAIPNKPLMDNPFHNPKAKKKRSTLTIPVSPFFHTSMRAKRFGDSKPVNIQQPTKAIARKSKQILKLTEPHEFSFSTVKRAIIRNSQKKKPRATVAYESEPEPEQATKWTAKLTEPREFRFRTAERNQVRQDTKKQIGGAEVKKATKRIRTHTHLTEPQSPFLHTKQRSQLKRKHSELITSSHDPYTDTNQFSTFDRDKNAPPRKRFRNSLTEPKPFHFQTEDRSVLRAAAKRSIDVYEEEAKEPWIATLTEPKPFHFATADRAEVRSLSKVKDPVSHLGMFDKENGAKRKRASSIFRDGATNLTQPRPFHFQTEDRALQKVEHNKVKQVTSKPAGKYRGQGTILQRKTQYRKIRSSPKVQAKLAGKTHGPTKHERQIARVKSISRVPTARHRDL